GVFRSTDNGEHWTPINTGLTYAYVIALAINSKGYLFAGTDGGGVFRSVQPTTAVRENINNMPASFFLEQNYPNPFNPGTTIQFIVPRSDYVTLKVYNALGAEVTTLVAKNLPAGKHQVVWNASSVAGGIYFYCLQVGDFVQTKKLVVMK
ncbi:MAG: T9SS type A sorting domain-containing protein, partial [bacterium]